jgi:predicted O-methyltransferase YrrM
MAVGLAAGVAGYLVQETWRSVGRTIVLARNFYGALVVFDRPSEGAMGPARVLRHGTVEHGEQFLDPRYQRIPTAYYTRNSGAGLAMRALMAQAARTPIHVGMIGLGAGTLAAYARPGDRYSIYEINPNVVRIARTQFTFLSGSPAPCEIVPGDARLALESEPGGNFDLLAVDAFSGDAIPIHLLTREAFALYWRHLKPDGVLAVHVTNRHVSLGPVVAMGAAESGKRAMIFSSPMLRAKGELASDWVLATSRPGFFELPDLAASARTTEPIPGLAMWTDDYSNLYRILR